MSPIVIADSDDDIDEQEYSPVPQPTNVMVTSDAHTRSSDRVSHTTVSTDPAFFQSVFNEQKEAAARVTRQMSEATGGDALSSALVKPAGQLTASPQASGPHSVYNRVSEKRRPASNLSSPTCRKHEVPMKATAKDMWDVPSSPETKAVSGPSKMKGSRNKGVATVKITRGLRKNLESLGYESEEEAIYEEIEDGGSGDITSARPQKKRRLASRSCWDTSLPGSTTGSPRNEGGSSHKIFINDVTSDDCVPTLPVDNESSFLVAPKPLSASQKVEYQSVELVQSSPCMRHPEVPHPKMGSSGTATNLNTPRSDMPSSHDIGIRPPTPDSEAIGHTRRVRPPPRRRRSSSPDVIAGTSHGQDHGLAEKQLSKTAPTGDAAPDGDVLDAKLDEDADFAVPVVPVERKRQRGRPKKSAVKESGKDSEGAVADADPESTDKPKKKRGRPKKAKPATEAELESPRDDAPDKGDSAGVEEPGDADATQEQPDDGETGSKKTDPGPGEEEAAAVSSKRPEATEERGHASEVDRGKAVEATARGKPKGLSRPGSEGKPVYRVGLSKRLRIAPLLKSLPK